MAFGWWCRISIYILIRRNTRDATFFAIQPILNTFRSSIIYLNRPVHKLLPYNRLLLILQISQGTYATICDFNTTIVQDLRKGSTVRNATDCLLSVFLMIFSSHLLIPTCLLRLLCCGRLLTGKVVPPMRFDTYATTLSPRKGASPLWECDESFLFSDIF